VKAKKVVLAYSGGLDTSVILKWLQDNYGCEVVTFTADIGQGEELEPARRKAKMFGVKKIFIEDLREEFVRDFVFPMFRANAVYEGEYLLGTSIARPLIAKHLVEIAKQTGADAISHGATGKGNDQVRFELGAYALMPDVRIIAPWREWDIVSREDAIRYAARHGVPIAQTQSDLFSRDANLWHISHEGGPLEDPAVAPPESMWKLTASAGRQPATPEKVTIGFESGRPMRLNGKALDPVTLVTALNQMAGRHGVGRTDLVESRLVGMKSRGAYETPAGTVLYEALEDLCRLTLPHDLLRTRAELAPRMAELIYNGLWFSPLRRALQAFVDTALQVASGEVTVELFHGRAQVVARTSPQTLYRPDLASFDMTGYDAHQAEGFIRLFGLPLATAARRGSGADVGGGDGVAVEPPAEVKSGA